MRTRLVILLLAACGNSHTATIDAAKQIDAELPDALLDAPAPPAGAHRFVIDHEHLPTTNSEALAFGLDLDNDGLVDNQLGMVIESFNAMGISTQSTVDHAIDTGALEILVDLEATDLTTAAQASVALFDGSDAMPAPCNGSADTTCRHHLAGTATFDVAATSAHDTPLAGAIVAGVVDTGPGTLHLRTAIFNAPIDLALVGARIRLTQPSDTAITTGIIAGAITQTEINTSLIPGLRTAATTQIAIDCNALTSPPACGCTDGSTGKTFVGLFDSNHDCSVSEDELESNSLITSLLAPDVSIGGMPALSLGVQVSAVHAAFTP